MHQPVDSLDIILFDFYNMLDYMVQHYPVSYQMYVSFCVMCEYAERCRAGQEKNQKKVS